VSISPLEKEWLTYTTSFQKQEFWSRMKSLIDQSDYLELSKFLEQLDKSKLEIDNRIEAAIARAEAVGFKRHSK
jgi:ribosomal protein L20